MNKKEVYQIFLKQETIKYNKGYELFEQVYEELKDKENLIRKEDDDTIIITHRFWYGKENK